MAAVHQHGQLDDGWAAVVHERIQRTADGAARIEHVVHQHDVLAVQIERKVRDVDFRIEGDRRVVAIERDVQGPHGNLDPFYLLDALGQPMGQHIAARDDAHQGKVIRAVVALQDLMRDTRKRTIDLGRVHDNGLHVFAALHTHSLRVECVQKMRTGRMREMPRIFPDLPGCGYKKSLRPGKGILLFRSLRPGFAPEGRSSASRVCFRLVSLSVLF